MPRPDEAPGAAPVDEPAGARTALVLGGTTEARLLADALTADGWAVTTSLAGRTSAPTRPDGQVRIGGFGGADGLAAWLRGHRPTVVVDATHPFAARMTEAAALACADVAVPLIVLRRPSWSGTRADAAAWDHVPDHATAARRAAELAEAPIDDFTVLLTVGRQATPAYVAALAHHRVLARVTEARDLAVPPGWRIIADRGPFPREAEQALFASAPLRVLVTKDSGGAATAAKLDIAAERGIRVVMVDRPPLPAGVESVGTVAEARDWCRRRAQAEA